MDKNTTRRSLLRLGTGAIAYGAGAAAVAGGLAIAGEARGASLPSVSPALFELIETRRRHYDRLHQWYQTTFNPAADAQWAAHNAIDAKPPLTIAVPPYANWSGELYNAGSLTTASSKDVARCRGIVGIPLRSQSQDPAWQATYRAARRIVAYVKRQERAKAKIDRDHMQLGLLEQETRLWQPISAADAAIMAFPVASLADVRAKLDHIADIECEEDGGVFAMIDADVRRLMTGEA